MSARGIDMANEVRRHQEWEEEEQSKFEHNFVYTREILFEKYTPNYKGILADFFRENGI